MERVRVAIVGYGNLGRGVEKAVRQNQDMELVAIFSRRPAGTVKVMDKECSCPQCSRCREVYR